MSGLLVLLLVAAVLLVALLAALLVREARRPPRRTAAYAVAHGMPCDPGEIGLPFASWTLDRPGGVTLPVWEIEGRGPAPAVVLLHGWGSSRIDLLGETGRWRSRCRRVVLYDLRGHGEATGGASRLGHGEEEDLLALLDRLGAGPFVLAGRSMGAVVALHAAARAAPGRVAGVVASGVYDEFHRTLVTRLRLARYPTHPVTDLARAWMRLTGLRQRPTRRILDAVTCPVLLLHGADDPIAPIAVAEAMAGAAPAVTLHRVEGAGHGDLPAADPAGQEEAIDRFLGALPSVSAPPSRPVRTPRVG